MLSEERRKQSEFVGQPQKQRETPSSFQGTLSVWGQPLSKLVELPSVFVSTLSVFREPHSAWGRTLHAFRRMP
jgi:hypothetical protein